MANTLYQLSIATFVNSLQNLSIVLQKGEDHATQNSLPHSQLLEARLAPDMYALPFQIQRVSDTAKGTAVRLAGITPTSMPDTETTFADLQARIAKTIELLQSVPEESLVGKEGGEIKMPFPQGEMTFTGVEYLKQYALPNFFFHVGMVYALLRGQGVPVGKLDYLFGAKYPDGLK